MPNVPVIDPSEIEPNLERRHRDVMLDLILAWGELDGALGMFLSRVLGVSFVQGAELIGRVPGSAKLAEVVKIIRDVPNGADAARNLRKHKKNYERYSIPRNRIAHSKCVGIWTRNQDFIVFAVFEKVDDNLLALDAIPIQEMQRATRWGKAMTALALKIADAP